MPLSLLKSRWSIPLFVGVVLALGVGLGVWEMQPSAPSYIRDGVVESRAAAVYWSDEIRRIGVSDAADELVTQGERLSSPQSHVLAHAFGDALYDATGSEGLTACPADFSQGCAHELIGRTIVERGLDAVGDFFSACVRAGTSTYVCMHSIGHGILGYFGYDDTALTRALVVCKAHDAHARSSCIDGVFMEYFLRFLAAGENGASSVRSLEGGQMYGPCASVDSFFGPACAFELPRWKLYFENPELTSLQQFQNLESYCQGMSDNRLVRGCFEGVGALASIQAGNDVGEAVELCRGAEADASFLYCVTGVVLHLHYWNVPNYGDVCTTAGLTDTALRYCKAYASTNVEAVGALPLYNP